MGPSGTVFLHPAEAHQRRFFIRPQRPSLWDGSPRIATTQGWRRAREDARVPSCVGTAKAGPGVSAVCDGQGGPSAAR
eukprot:5936050-Lingulodinium_polyedra.AAC.1